MDGGGEFFAVSGTIMFHEASQQMILWDSFY